MSLALPAFGTAWCCALLKASNDIGRSCDICRSNVSAAKPPLDGRDSWKALSNAQQWTHGTEATLKCLEIEGDRPRFYQGHYAVALLRILPAFNQIENKEGIERACGIGDDGGGTFKSSPTTTTAKFKSTSNSADPNLRTTRSRTCRSSGSPARLTPYLSAFVYT
jgi:hypothetical protein